jgi:hypothetical protein
MVNLSLRGMQFLFAIIINFILVQLVPDEEAEAIAVTLIMIALNIQIIFGVIGTYILNRINSRRKEMSIVDPEPFLYLVFLLSIIMLMYFILTEQNWFSSVISVALAQGNFQLINSYYGVKKSIRKSLILGNAVYFIFLLLLLVSAIASTLTAKIWLSTFALANVFGAYLIIKELFKTTRISLQLAKKFIVQRSVYIHGTGHMILSVIGWFCFLYIRTFFSESNTVEYVDFLKVGIFISLLVGASELLFNTIFLTKVLRNPDDASGFVRYADALCLMLIGVNIMMIVTFPILSNYYFSISKASLATAFGILLCIENTKVIFNIVINNSARKFEYRKIISVSFILVLTTSLLSLTNQLLYIGIVLVLISIITGTIVFKQGSLSMSGIFTFTLLNIFVLSYFQIFINELSMAILIVLGVLIIGFTIKILQKVNASDLIREFLKYD